MFCKTNWPDARRRPRAYFKLPRSRHPAPSRKPTMPGYATKTQRVAIAGVADLTIRSLLDREQFADPLGEAERLGISSAAWPIFGLLWPSGAQLAACLALRPVRAAERILEVGCGLALASLVGHRRGADITASDCHPLAEAFLRHNLALNHLAPMKYRQGLWSPVAPAVAQPGGHAVVSGRFDLIIGSDVLYERDSEGALAAFIGRHAQACAEVWIVDPDRGNRPAFNRRMAEQGFSLDQARLDVPADTPMLTYKGRWMRFRRPSIAP